MEKQTEWELLNPQGAVRVEQFKVNPHPATLEGKAVLLRWNGKHNGDVFLNRIAEHLRQDVKGVSIIKAWEVAPETATISDNPATSQEFARKLAGLKPDISIASQAD